MTRAFATFCALLLVMYLVSVAGDVPVDSARNFAACTGDCKDKVVITGNMDTESIETEKTTITAPKSMKEEMFCDVKYGNVELTTTANVVNSDSISALETTIPKIRSPTGTVTIMGVTTVTGSIRYDTKAGSFLELGSAPDVVADRWIALGEESFDDVAATSGWVSVADGSVPDVAHLVTTCRPNGNPFLGGHCSSAAATGLVKRFDMATPHTQLRLRARVNFVDNWTGEAAFAKVDGAIVWLDTHTSESSSVVLDVCGNPLYSDTKLGELVDVIVPHTGNSVSIAFGSTLLPEKASCEASWGVDDVQLWVQ